jgi:hypothetical protein
LSRISSCGFCGRDGGVLGNRVYCRKDFQSDREEKGMKRKLTDEEEAYQDHLSGMDG